MSEPLKTDVRDSFNKVFQIFRTRMDWGWEMAALDSFRDAILCLENGNPGGALSYVKEADGYLAAIVEGRPWGCYIAPSALKAENR